MDADTSDHGRPSIAITAVIVGIAILLWLVVPVLLIFVVPSFEKTFADFRMRLPLSTEVVIAMSRWCVKYFYILPMPLGMIAVGVGAPTWLIRHLVRKPRLGVIWSTLMLVLP